MTDINADILTLNGVEYVKKDVMKPAETHEGMPYCIVRTYSAGVFAGYVKERNGKEGTVCRARRLHYWDGAASLSQLSLEGVKKPENCRFPAEVPFVELTEIIEVLPCSQAAKANIENVPIWEMK